MSLTALAATLDNFIEKIDTDPAWKDIHRVADAAEPALETLFRVAVERMRQGISFAAIERAMKAGSVPEVEDALPWDIFESTMSECTELLYNLVLEGGDVSTPEFRRFFVEQQGVALVRKASVSPEEAKRIISGQEADVGLDLSFNMRNPKAIQWALEESSTLITQITIESRLAIRNIISNAFAVGGHPYETAKTIKNYIGLTDRDAKAALSLEQRLLASGLSKEKVAAAVEKYRNKKLLERAKLIARTETIASANAGQQLHWKDMQNKGYLDEEEIVREWIATPDDRMCEECAALDGTTAPLNGTFPGGVKQPPLHPDCRCAVGLRKKPAM